MGNAPWPHAPPHWLINEGVYFVTDSTYHREQLFDTDEKLEVVTRLLVETAEAAGWTLRAWAVFSNHYHLLADSPKGNGESLRLWLAEFHRSAAVEVNRIAGAEGRRVWMNFRETFITHQTSLLARLRYVNEIAVKHGLVEVATDYPWCSAGWFEKTAPAGFRKSVARFKTDRVNVPDDFDL